MIHSDILNSLTDNEKVMLLACIRHATNGDYKYADIQYMRKPFFREVLQKYYNIVAKKHKNSYKNMVDKVNTQLKLL
jgi:hypothetical protein